MSQRAPTSPYEAAWQRWNYGGGASRGEPMPRIEDYPDTFEEDRGARAWVDDGRDAVGGGPIATDMAAGESAKRDKYDRGGDLRPGQRIEQIQPDYAPVSRVGGQVTDEYGQAVYPGMGEDRLYASPASPDEVYGAYAPQPARPGMASNVMGGAMGNAMARPGMARAALGGAMGSAMRKPGLLKRAAGGLMGAMTLGQLNRRKGY